MRKVLMSERGIIETDAWVGGVGGLAGGWEIGSSESHLCERLLDGSATSEGTSANDRDHGKHEGEGDPTHPSECLESLGRVAVREGVSKVGTVESATSSGGEGNGTSEPEDPSHEEGDCVTGNRGDDTADASKEETSLLMGSAM